MRLVGEAGLDNEEIVTNSAGREMGCLMNSRLITAVTRAVTITAISQMRFNVTVNHFPNCHFIVVTVKYPHT